MTLSAAVPESPVSHELRGNVLLVTVDNPPTHSA